ncbi:MAG: hypothetical protein ACKVQQ_15150 [Burkholderiales bacterium]
MEDLEFTVPAGPAGGAISLSRDASYDPGKPTVMLLVGYTPGSYEIEARDRTSGTLLARARYAVTTDWGNADRGPGQVYEGTVLDDNIGLAPGGGAIGPQSVNIFPALGVRRLAILFVDTATQRYPTVVADMDVIRQQWQEEVIDGYVVGGIAYSTKRYYEEVSYGNLTLSGTTYGPVNLPGAWDSYFASNGLAGPAGSRVELFLPKSALVFQQACITVADGLIDFRQVDIVIIVVRSIDSVTPPRKIRANATLGKRMFVTSHGPLPLATIVMPHDEGTWDIPNFQWHLGNGQICSVVAHELGHSLGMGDLYAPDVPDPAGGTRNPWGYDLMHNAEGLPHFALAHRLMLGWVPAAWVEAVNHPPVNASLTLSPIELGQPPVGSKIGAEVRIADGWNYYFEYRDGQIGHIGDDLWRHGLALPPHVVGRSIVGTDVVDPKRMQDWPDKRPYLLRVPLDADDDGPVLQTGQDFKDPQYPDLKVTLGSVAATGAQIRVEYGLSGQPDPSIRPWPAGPNRPYQSPDIEVRNVANAGRPDRFNLPWLDHDNTVVATVTNAGDLDATNVTVNFYRRIYNAGGVLNETSIGSDSKGVPKGQSREFSCQWRPTVLGGDWHYCIVVRIPPYSFTTPLGQVVRETTGLNNVAQSNYSDFFSGTMSPPSRETSTFTVGNPYPVRTSLTLQVRQTNPLYRTYLDHRNLTLDPGETRRVRAMFEYMIDPDTPLRDRRLRNLVAELGGRPNHVALYSLIEDRRDPHVHTDKWLGGAEVRVRTGIVTRFEKFELRGRTASGSVVRSGDGKPVRDGEVVVVLRYSGKRREDYAWAKLQGGRFSVDLAFEGRCKWLEAEYFPGPGLGECRSERIDCEGKKAPVKPPAQARK